ncbi:hypothetical protein BDP27DRAFT_1371711 [Rhodocollybia butyracea]|uniref:Uncharacterized protein n=1 Tax=Rhodocollybia butyracea TaxID=206335 RepID=A0A9P5TZ90_9AGAR|nr:hypothetical protein BDP27DRAFT_1371711 [Rhodocollybia butyracea]
MRVITVTVTLELAGLHSCTIRPVDLSFFRRVKRLDFGVRVIFGSFIGILTNERIHDRIQFQIDRRLRRRVQRKLRDTKAERRRVRRDAPVQAVRGPVLLDRVGVLQTVVVIFQRACTPQDLAAQNSLPGLD